MAHILDTPHSSRQIHLSTVHCSTLDDETHSRAVWHLDEPVDLPPNVNILIGLVSAQIPHSVLPWKGTEVLTMSIQGGGVHEITFEKGIHSADDLVVLLSQELSAAGVTCSFNSSTIRFKLVAQHALTIVRAPTQLGFAEGQTGTSVEALSACRLSGISSLLVGSGFALHSMESQSKARANILARVPVDVPVGGLLHHKDVSGFRQLLADNSFTSIQLTLYDENQQPVNMNGLHWSATLQLDFNYQKEQILHKGLHNLREADELLLQDQDKKPERVQEKPPEES